MSTPTAAQRNAASHLGNLANFNAKSTKDQLARSLATFDASDKQNRALADTQFQQNSEQTAGDRFAEAKKLQASTSGVLAAAGNAMQGSAGGTVSHMLKTRNDLDSGEALSTLTQNQDTVRNALTEAINANILARRNAKSDAEFALRGIEADTAAQLNNMNPELYQKPGTGKAKVGSRVSNNMPGPNTKHNSTPYYMPAAAVPPPRPTTPWPRILPGIPQSASAGQRTGGMSAAVMPSANRYFIQGG